ncbi:MAG TPA: hypothetical protein VGL06_02155 [Pseudonocardiaceae bacterium]
MGKFIGKRLAITAAVLMGLVGMVGIGAGVSVAAPVQAAPAAVTAAAKTPSVVPHNLLVLGVTQNGVNMRACASTSCPVSGTANRSDTLHSWCFVTGQTISGNPFWDIVYNVSTGRVGFITESLLTNGSQGSVC